MTERWPILNGRERGSEPDPGIEAYEQLSALDPSRLGPEDLEGLAEAAWWLSKIPESLAVRQRAYSAWAAAGEDRPAAFTAWGLAAEHFHRELLPLIVRERP